VEKCRRVAEELLGPTRPPTLRGEHWLKLASANVNGACALKALGRHEEALEMGAEGLRLLERRFSHHKAQVAQVLDLMAELCLLCGQQGEAEQHLARALKLKTDFAFPQASLAASWNLQGQAFTQGGNVEGAKAAFRRALAAHLVQSSEPPAAAATVLSNYAGLLRQQGHYGEAAQLYRRAAEIFEAQLGPDHAAVGHTLVELGAMHVQAGSRGHSAVEPLTRALVVLSTALGDRHSSVLATMGWLSKCRGSAAEASGPEAEAEARQGPWAEPAGCPVERLLAEQRADA